VRTIGQVARLRRPDGVEIEWQVSGADGPLVAIAPMSLHPMPAYRPIIADLAADHRVLTWFQRGMGGSSHSGPYDMETDAADLAAVVEEAGGDALVIGSGDGSRRAVRAAAERPDLIHTVVVSGETPLGSAAEGGGTSSEALANSPAVLAALVGMLDSDYRAGLRTMFASSGEDEWDEGALRERLDVIEAQCPREVGLPRMRAWVEDDSREHARALGDRLWFVHYPGNAWFQGSLEVIRRTLPEARFEPVSEGVLSRPAENAAVVRRILATRRAAA
jgi:pimeloyl-ACP methyl ester carboxylesterase